MALAERAKLKREEEALGRGLLAASTYNAAGCTKKGTKAPFTAEDFVPRVIDDEAQAKALRAQFELDFMPRVNASFQE